MLFPLSVIKTRQMASHGVSGGFKVRARTHARMHTHKHTRACTSAVPRQHAACTCTCTRKPTPTASPPFPSLQGTRQTASMVWRREGVPGFYRGFSTVVFGTIPARAVRGAAGSGVGCAGETLRPGAHLCSRWPRGRVGAAVSPRPTLNPQQHLPVAQIYLTSLEVTKSAMSKVGKTLELSDTATAGFANFAAGAGASLSTQIVTCPIDVISQRQVCGGRQGGAVLGVHQ